MKRNWLGGKSYEKEMIGQEKLCKRNDWLGKGNDLAGKLSK